MDHHLRDLFKQELAAEPPLQPGNAARDAMTAGTRLRRRRTALTVTGTATAVQAVIAAAAVFGLPLPGRDGGTPLTDDARCTAGQQADTGNVIVYLRDGVTDAARTGLGLRLQSDTRVQIIEYVSRDEAYQRFEQLWSAGPGAPTDPQQPREQFQIHLKAPGTVDAFIADLRPERDIDEILAVACLPGMSR
jgi:hypothetical protein